ncbi:uncharacterized protein LOC110271893 [Arachis ipaensis]|uniref:uncharacterized protein LOC110271893 n=1 Tax=Arachis ipaensis TaxID=130454 RepID=UPI000A2B3F88|nr:uncharacterized protein LOC110271893 [Arachis ipaensis]
MNDLLRLFHMVWRWDETERSETRRVWLECYGVPLHAWSKETFTRLGDQWGEVVKCDNLTETCNSFSVGRVLIDTCMFDMINEWVHVTIGTSGFDVLVKEVGSEVYREECFPEDKWDQGGRLMVAMEDVQQAEIREKASGGAGARGTRRDPVAELMEKEHSTEEQDKDKIVILSSKLNEWNIQVSNYHYEGHDHSRTKGKEILRVTDTNNQEIDLDCTLSCNCDGIQIQREKSSIGAREGIGLNKNKPNTIIAKDAIKKSKGAQMNDPKADRAGTADGPSRMFDGPQVMQALARLVGEPVNEACFTAGKWRLRRGDDEASSLGTQARNERRYES